MAILCVLGSRWSRWSIDARPGANTLKLLVQVENLAIWSSIIDTSWGWKDEARERHFWNDVRHSLAAPATKIFSGSWVALVSAMAEREMSYNQTTEQGMSNELLLGELLDVFKVYRPLLTTDGTIEIQSG